MPSSLSAGPIKTLLRISKTLRVMKGGRFIIEQVDALPAVGTRQLGDITVYNGKLYLHTGAAWVIVGTQT